MHKVLHFWLFYAPQALTVNSQTQKNRQQAQATGYWFLARLMIHFGIVFDDDVCYFVLNKFVQLNNSSPTMLLK